MATLAEILKTDSSSNVVKIAALKPEVSQRTGDYSHKDISNPRTPRPSDLKAMGIYNKVSDVQANQNPVQPVGKLIMSNAPQVQPVAGKPVTPNVAPNAPVPHTVETTTTTQHFHTPQQQSTPVSNNVPQGNSATESFLGGNRETKSVPEVGTEPIISPMQGAFAKAKGTYNNMSSGQKGFAAGVAALPVAYGAYQAGKKLMSKGKQSDKSDESDVKKTASERADDYVASLFLHFKEASFQELSKNWEDLMIQSIKGEA